MAFTLFNAPPARRTVDDRPGLPEDAALREALLRTVADGGSLLGGNVVHGFSLVREMARPSSVLAWAAVRLDCGDVTLVLKRDRPECTERWQGAPGVKLKTEYDRMTEVAAFMAPYPDLKTPCPVAHFPDLGVVVMHHSRGENLEELIRRQARWSPAAETVRKISGSCEKAGSWLRMFHQATRRDGERFSIPELEEDVRLRLDLLLEMGARGMTGKLRAEVMSLFERAAEEVDGPDHQVVKVHGDFYPGNVLVAPDRTVVLDFVRDGWGSVYHDAMRFDVTLSMLLFRGCYRPGVVQSFRRSFARGVGKDLGPRQPMARLFRIRHLACEWVNALRRQGGPISSRLYDRWWIGRVIPFLIGRLAKRS